MRASVVLVNSSDAEAAHQRDDGIAGADMRTAGLPRDWAPASNASNLGLDEDVASSDEELQQDRSARPPPPTGSGVRGKRPQSASQRRGAHSGGVREAAADATLLRRLKWTPEPAAATRGGPGTDAWWHQPMPLSLEPHLPSLHTLFAVSEPPAAAAPGLIDSDIQTTAAETMQTGTGSGGGASTCTSLFASVLPALELFQRTFTPLRQRAQNARQSLMSALELQEEMARLAVVLMAASLMAFYTHLCVHHVYMIRMCMRVHVCTCICAPL